LLFGSTCLNDFELALAFARRTNLALTDLGFGLFLGAGRAADNAALLQRHGITHILNVADDVPRAPGTEGLEYFCLGVGDFGTDAGISRVFDAALSFVKPALEAEGSVFIHCANGSNRSPSVAIALLMMLFDWSLATAWEHVACRRTIQPLADNRRELLVFERTRRSVASMAEGVGGTLVALEHTPSNDTSERDTSAAAALSTAGCGNDVESDDASTPASSGDEASALQVSSTEVGAHAGSGAVSGGKCEK